MIITYLDSLLVFGGASTLLSCFCHLMMVGVSILHVSMVWGALRANIFPSNIHWHSPIKPTKHNHWLTFDTTKPFIPQHI